MHNILDKYCLYIMDTLYHQSVFCIILFILIFSLSKICKGTPPHWQLGLWVLILIRLILPIDLSLSFSARDLADDFLPIHTVNSSLEKVSDRFSINPGPNQTYELRFPIQTARQSDAGMPTSPEGYGPKKSALSRPVTLFLLWLCGVLTFSLLFLKKIRSIKHVLKESSLVRDKRIMAILDYWRQSFNITRPVVVYSSDKFLSPFTTGLFRPGIFIPEPLLENMDNDSISSIIAHEMVHIKHFDHVWIRLQNALQIIYFFNPVVWYANSRINIERDRLCDSLVLARRVIPPKAFGKSVVDVLKFHLSGYRDVEPLLCFSNHKNIYEYRIRDILRGESISKPKSFSIFISICLLGLFLLPMSNADINIKKPEMPNSAPLATAEKAEGVLEVDGVMPEAHEDSIILPEPNNGKAESKNLKKEVYGPKDAIDHKSPVAWKKTFKKDEAPSKTAMDREKADAPAEITRKPDHFEAALSKASIEKGQKKEETAVPILIEKKEEASEYAVRAPEKTMPGRAGISAEHVKQEKSPAVDYFSRGIASLKKGRIEDAISDFNKAIDLDPGKAVPYVARGSAYFRLDRFDDAMSDYNDAIEINPDFAPAYQNRGSVYYKSGRLDEAISDYNKSIALNPNLAASYQDRGSIYLSRDRLDEAIDDYSKALALYPEDPVTYGNRGIAYFAKEQYQKALDDFNRAIEMDPEYADVYIFRGFYFQVMEEYDKAVADYNKALKLNPEIDSAKRLLNEVVQLSVSTGSVDDRTDDNQKTVCRWVKTFPFKKSVECKTKKEWARLQKANKQVAVMALPRESVNQAPSMGQLLDMYSRH